VPGGLAQPGISVTDVPWRVIVTNSVAEASQVTHEPILSLRNVSVTFGGVKALQDVGFEVLPGEVQCIAGENGSGKSTLIKVITGVHQPNSGSELVVAGRPVVAMSPAQAHAAGFQVIWQDLALFDQMTVAENIAIEAVLGAVPRFANHALMRRTALAVLERLGTRLDVDARLGSFSVAQRQLVAIARALVREARVIFMDEPTSSLTRHETNLLLNVVRKLSRSGIAVVFVSHRLAEVLEISTRVTVLRDGRLVGVYPTKGMTQAHLSELMTGKMLSHAIVARDHSAAPTLLSVSGLTRRGEYHDVSFSVRRGETVGLTGLLGAGRTELALAIFGMRRPEGGTITVDGVRVNPRSNRDSIRAGIGYLPEDRLSLGLIQPQSIADNLSITVLDKLLKRRLISRRKKRGLVQRWISNLGIKVGETEHPISTLSGGNQQRVVIAKWLATEPKLLILDCPTVGVDVGARAGIFEIVRQLASQGLGILLISDEVPEVYFNSDRILHMAEGRIVGEYDPRQIGLADVERAVYA
jgi:simple sugar transport system ATP-binding protein